MKYISIDLETTGIDPEQNQIIEFGAIIEDSKNPLSYEESKKYRRVILARDRVYNFSSYAARLNANLIALISDIENGRADVKFTNNSNLTETAFYVDELISDFKIWLLANGFIENSQGTVQIVAAGKNFSGFDKQFINKLEPLTYGLNIKYKAIDPAPYFIDWDNDLEPPSSDECLKRAGVDAKTNHEALADAWNVIQLLRTQYGRDKNKI